MVKAEALDDATLVVTFRREARPRRAALCRRPADLLARPITRRGRSTNRRSIFRWARGPTRSAGSRSTATSNTTASRTGGAPIFRSAAAATISTSCATNSIATATSRSKGSPARTICSARSSPRGSGRRATISPPSRTAASSARSCRTKRRRARRAGSSTPAASKFKDPRVREALIYAFDFEWTNKTIMYGAYARTHSPFQNSDMMANGPPSPEELKLLEPFRGQVPDEVFGEPFVPPVSDGSGQDRTLLRKASQLLQRCRLRRSRTASGCCRTASRSRSNFCSTSRRSSRTTRPTSRTSARSASRPRCGWSMPVQYRARVEDFDFDMTIQRFSMSATPGDSMRPYLLLAGGGHQGLLQSGRHRRSRRSTR